MNTIKMIQFVRNNYFILFFIGIILLILILSIFRINKKGTWSETYFIEAPISSSSVSTHSKKYRKHNFSKKNKDSKGEIECRRVLEKIFKLPFPKKRPSFLQNTVINNGYNLELDCFNQDLKIAVEYNGRQHYDFIPFFHKNKDAFQNQQYRDYLKKSLCKKNNIILISVPYTVKHKHIESFLIKQLKSKHILI